MKPLSALQVIRLARSQNVQVDGILTTTTVVRTGKKQTEARLAVFFKRPKPDLWATLLTSHYKEGVHVSIGGTRVISGNGAVDGMLLPPYKKRLEAVNAKRAKMGLKPILN